MRRAGRVVAEMHERIRPGGAPGVTLAQLDTIGREVLPAAGRRRTSSATTATRR